jgi:glycosyltransferase 2 family protein
MTNRRNEPPADERLRGEDEPPSALDGLRRPLRFAVAVAATGAVMALLLDRFGAGLSDALRGAQVGWIAAAFAMSTAGVLLGALRWQVVLESMRYRLGFWRALVAVLATWPLVVVTPSRASDFLRAVAVRRTVPLAAGTGSVLAEKVVDMSLLLLMAALGAAIEGLWLWSGLAAAALLALVAGVALLVAHRARFARLPLIRSHAQKVEDLFLAFDALLAAPWRLASTCGLSLVIRGLTLGITFALLRAVDADVDLFDTCALWPVATLIGLLPLTLAGVGTRDAMFMYLLSERGHLLTRVNVLAATMGYSAINVGAFAVIGLPFMAHELARMREARQTDGPRPAAREP